MTLKTVFDNLLILLTTICAIVAIIGLTRIAYLWNTGRYHEIDSQIYLWIGGIVLFLVAGLVSRILFL